MLPHMPSGKRKVLLCLLFAFCAAAQAFAQNPELRGLWVDAWGNGFLNAAQSTQLISDCRKYNFNAIYVQMRRRGDAFYTPHAPNSDPKTTAISASYDALGDLVTKAHSGSPRIEVHCWVTANLVWSSPTPPSQPGHVVNLHPEYLMANRAGENFLAEGYYLDPGNPEAMLWNYRMAMDIVEHYAVDGFHWDYIRYPEQDAGYNQRALARYQAEFNVTTKPAISDTRFATWRRRQVTDFLRWVNADLLEVRPGLVISAAVFADRNDAFTYRFQDWNAWNGEGIIDVCIPMNYTADNSGIFNPRVNDAFTHQGLRRVYVGQGSYLNTKQNTVTQLQYVRNKGLLGSLFYSYRTPNSGTVNQADTFDYVKANYQPSWAETPSLPWKANPTGGIAKGTITALESGEPLYNATVTLQISPIKTQKTEPHGKFAFFEVPEGSYTITASAAGLVAVTNVVVVEAGKVSNFDFALPSVPVEEPLIVIRQIARTETNSVQLLVDGSVGVKYDLLISPDLAEWSVVTNMAPSTTPFTLEDKEPPFSKGFYRVKKSP